MWLVLFGLKTSLRLLGILLVWCAATAALAACESMSEAGHDYVVCTFDLRKDNLGLYWQGADGAPLGGAGPLASLAESKGRRLVFAMNAGMYDKTLAPVGLYIENGRMMHKANTKNGFGNFHMKPNGVFYFGNPWMVLIAAFVIWSGFRELRALEYEEQRRRDEDEIYVVVPSSRYPHGTNVP